VRMPHWNRRGALLQTPPYQAKLGGDERPTPLRRRPSNQKADAQEVPPEFWWVEGDAPQKQNWTSGDFTTYTNQGDTRHKALGVSFSRDDIEKLIPTEPEGDVNQST
jgi:hypothetical protein